MDCNWRSGYEPCEKLKDQGVIYDKINGVKAINGIDYNFIKPIRCPFCGKKIIKDDYEEIR